MTAQEIDELIQNFLKQDFGDFDPRFSFAHIVLEDYNLDDESIDFCLEAKLAYLLKNERYTTEIEKVANFLIELKSIPESERLSLYSEWDIENLFDNPVKGTERV